MTQIYGFTSVTAGQSQTATAIEALRLLDLAAQRHPLLNSGALLRHFVDPDDALRLKIRDSEGTI